MIPKITSYNLDITTVALVKALAKKERSSASRYLRELIREQAQQKGITTIEIPLPAIATAALPN